MTNDISISRTTIRCAGNGRLSRLFTLCNDGRQARDQRDADGCGERSHYGSGWRERGVVCKPCSTAATMRQAERLDALYRLRRWHVHSTYMRPQGTPPAASPPVVEISHRCVGQGCCTTSTQLYVSRSLSLAYAVWHTADVWDYTSWRTWSHSFMYLTDWGAAITCAYFALALLTTYFAIRYTDSRYCP